MIIIQEYIIIQYLCLVVLALLIMRCYLVVYGRDVSIRKTNEDLKPPSYDEAMKAVELHM